MHIIGFSKYSQRFPKWLNQFASLLAVNESSVVLPLQQHFILPVFVVFFLIRQGGHKYEAISHCDFNLHFPMTNKAEHTSMFVYHLYTFRSVQFSHSVASNSLQLHGLQHASLPVHHQLPEFTQTHVH